MRLPVILCVAALLSFQLACTDKKQKQQLVLDTASLDSMEVYNAPGNFNSRDYRNKPFRLYTSINVSCASCIEKVYIWDSIYLKMDKDPDIAFIPIAQTKDNFEVFKFLFENQTIKNVRVPFFLDGNSSFTTSNSQLLGSQFDFLLLTDQDNKVLAFETRSDDASQISKMMAMTKKQ